MNWTIVYNGVEQTLADWGVNSVRRTLSSQALDMLTFRVPMQSGYDEPVFTEKTNLSLQRDGVQWFYGRVIAIETNVTAGEESHSYTVAGPWWWLDQTTFQQPWNVQSTGLDVAPFLKSHLLLNYKLVGNVLTKTSIGEQIAEAVAFAIADGARCCDVLRLFDHAAHAQNPPSQRTRQHGFYRQKQGVQRGQSEASRRHAEGSDCPQVRAAG